MDSKKGYSLLQNLTSPVVAITSRNDNNVNGMIANSAGRASLVPDQLRISFYCFKQHYSHKLISNGGRFCLHLLHRNQFDLVRALGFETGEDVNKLNRVESREGTLGCPILKDHYAWFECRVVNAMDAGASTFFLGEVESFDVHAQSDSLQLLDSKYFRENMPSEWVELYKKNKQRVQEWARDHMDVDTSYSWQS